MSCWLDLRSKNITGKEAETVLHDVGITVNKNSIPNDPQNHLSPAASESVPLL